MRTAIFSDIHANLPALQAVLADIDHEQPDHAVCLGDVASTGPQPREVVRLLRERGYPTVMGNVDVELFDPQHSQLQDEDSLKFVQIDQWCASQLALDDLDYLRTFQPTIALDLGGITLLAFHGSPRSNTEIIVATTPDDVLGEMLLGFDATIFCGGHTHTQMLRRYRQSLVLNPGSVGLPHEYLPDGSARNPPWAEYALVEWSYSRLSVDLRRVPYDIAPLVQSALTSGMPHAQWWVQDWK